MANGIMIAGTHSGSGKTTVAMAVLKALRNRGFKVQPFKVGPDYIDPVFHRMIAGLPSRNLDCWMMGEGIVASVYARWSSDSDVSVVEGVMGLYDGYGSGRNNGSSAHIARLLGLPVVLVVNCRGLGQSAGALVLGYKEYDPGVRLGGVILNNARDEAHFMQLKGAVEDSAGIPVIGYLQEQPAVSLPGRHLGLVYAPEIDQVETKIDRLGEMARKTIDLDRLLDLARPAHSTGPRCGAGPRGGRGPTAVRTDISALAKRNRPPQAVTVAVALDRAFHFYYQDNLDFIEELGARIAYFSPLADRRLPPGTAGVYLGGGYPELYAAQLEANVSLRGEILDLIRAGLPTYAECGGLMYLGRSIEDFEGRSFSMVGALPGRTRMTDRLINFGYTIAAATEESVATAPGMEIKGHEFHRSTFSLEEPVTKALRCHKVRDGQVLREWDCGYVVYRVLASYLHIHFLANPEVAAKFVRSCWEFSRQKAQPGPSLGPGPGPEPVRGVC